MSGQKEWSGLGIRWFAHEGTSGTRPNKLNHHVREGQSTPVVLVEENEAHPCFIFYGHSLVGLPVTDTHETFIPVLLVSCWTSPQKE